MKDIRVLDEKALRALVGGGQSDELPGPPPPPNFYVIASQQIRV